MDGGSNWNNGTTVTSKGYKMRLSPNHPNATRRGYVMEHRLVIEEHIGRFLKENEIVHHKNGDKSDNRIENLELMTNGEHTAMHNKSRQHSKKTKEKIRVKAKERFKNPKNHPSYKDIDPKKLIKMQEQGITVKRICEIKDICKGTFYNKVNTYKEMLKNAK